MSQVIAILLLVFSPLLFLYIAYRVHLLSETKAFYFNKLKWKTNINRQRYLEIDAVLTQRISFYNELSANGKAKFINRLCDLVMIKKFVGKEKLIITDEIRIVTCSAIVQLTYGLNEYRLDNIKGFVVYPSIFYNSIIKAYLKGGTPPEGMMSLSWKDLQHGFLIPNDKYNLGLHEMAHALKLSLTHAYDFDMKFASYIDKWDVYGSVEFLKMKRGNESFLRKYGGVNEHEFFAVCVEHFFEAPEQFQFNLPRIFYHLSVLLNLDPLNPKQDYLLVR